MRERQMVLIKFDESGLEGKEGVIAADTYLLTWVKFRAALSN